MDKLYTGDIPKDYKYILLYDGYIYLYNQPQAENETINCYKIDNNNGFLYCRDTLEISDLTNFELVETSSHHYDRTDFFNILCTSCIFALIIIFITNIVTSFFKKGGVFYGLF